MIIVVSLTTTQASPAPTLYKFFHNYSETDDLHIHIHTASGRASRRRGRGAARLGSARPRPDKRPFDADTRVITAPTLCSRNSLIIAIFYASQSNFLFYGRLFICYSLSCFKAKMWKPRPFRSSPFRIFPVTCIDFVIWNAFLHEVRNNDLLLYISSIHTIKANKIHFRYSIVNFLFKRTENERLWKTAKLSFKNCHHYSTWIFPLHSILETWIASLRLPFGLHSPVS